ncbi:DNA polymerase [Providencia alcalifaciens]
MKNILWLDLETFNEKPIKYGVHSYAETAEIMLFAWALNNNSVNVWDITNKSSIPIALKEALTDPNTIIYAHNSHFDRTILKHHGIKIDVSRWRDTMVQALAHGLPGALETLCEILGVPLDHTKNKEGKKLIQLFCKPHPKNAALHRATSKTHPEEWKRFVAYAGLDIEAMRAIHKRLPSWNYRDTELDHWHRDQKINDRGVYMDIQLATSALDAVETEQKRLVKLTQKLTDNEVKNATQRDALLQYISASFGVNLPDMQKNTLERCINDSDTPFPLRELLVIRLQANTTSTSKYNTLINGVSSDGRLRGTLQFCGASRTGRWAGRLFQPQNLPRPTLDQSSINMGIEALKAGCADLIYDDIMQLTSSALRGCIIAPEGKKLVVSDLSNIEGRILAWLAGETWKISAFSEFDKGIGTDLYKLTYSRAFDIAPDNINKNMRQIGKVMELGLGYGGGIAAFLTFALTYGLDLDELAEAALPNIPTKVKQDALNWYQKSVETKKTFALSETVFITCDSLKRMWRNAHPKTVSFWYELEDTVRRAITSPEVTFSCRKLKVRRDKAWLRIALPSGRVICYPSPHNENGQISYMGVNSYSRKWQRLKTYGGKLVENVTQAAARDILAGNMSTIEDHGYKIVLTIHDEVLTETLDNSAFNSEHLSELLSTNPQWALDLPLNAAGFETHRYRKD